MRFLLIIATLTICTWTNSAAARQTLESRVLSLAEDVREVMESDPRVMGQSLALGQFDGEGDASNSNFGLQIASQLQAALSSLLVEKSNFTLAGSYHYLQSEDVASPHSKVLVITAQIKDARGREVKAISIEINDVDSIYQALGLTGSATPNTTTATEADFRNQAAQRDHEKPTFEAVSTRIAAQNAPQWAVGILRKPSFDGPTSPITPQNVNGLAYTTIEVNEYYEIELVNNDSSDAVATVTVDGLDVANTFCVDKDLNGKLIRWPGYYVPSGKTVTIRGWLHTVDQTIGDNIFSFRVNKLGQGAATALKTRGKVGVITVQFREACEPGQKLRKGRVKGATEKGETAKGEGLQEKLEAKPIQIGNQVLSTVSIRYNRP
ncbi:MAG: hypothetical protein JNL58_27020 [Planctomyces sp.]|nr:hypothetical protein [Planctomyces sp.]